MKFKDEVAIKKVIKKSDLSASTREVLRALIGFSDVKRQCFPTVAQLMEEANLSERTVRSKIKELVSKGWLIKKEQFRKNGSQTSNFYIIQQPQQSTKIESVEEIKEMKQLDVEDETQAANQQAAAKVVEQVSNEDDIRVGQEEYNHAQVALEEVAQKKEALLSTATLPTTTYAQSSKPMDNDKPHIASMSSVFLRQLRDFLFNIKGSIQFWTLFTAELRGLLSHQALQNELVLYDFRERVSSCLSGPRMGINLNEPMYMIRCGFHFNEFSGQSKFVGSSFWAHNYFIDKDIEPIFWMPTSAHDIGRKMQSYHLIC